MHASLFSPLPASPRGFAAGFVLALCVLAAAGTARAQTPSLRLPADCVLGESCWIVNTVDVDPTNKAADFRCGTRSYDGHRGTDFGLADRAAMDRGVAILAAAAGTVRRTRDGAPDEETLTEDARQAMLETDTGCGNGVLIDHGAGWQTLYCHMKNGSVAVQPGQAVPAGTPLGQIGTSGIAAFPHVHISVLFEGTVVDPFTDGTMQDGCGRTGKGLWDETVRSADSADLYAAGFRTGIPDTAALARDVSSPANAAADSPALTFWAALYGVADGDRITLEIRDPEGDVFAQRSLIQSRNRARQFYYAGRRTADTGLRPGLYTGTAQISRTLRDGRILTRQKTQTLTVR